MQLSIDRSGCSVEDLEVVNQAAAEYFRTLAARREAIGQRLANEHLLNGRHQNGLSFLVQARIDGGLSSALQRYLSFIIASKKRAQAKKFKLTAGQIAEAQAPLLFAMSLDSINSLMLNIGTLMTDRSDSTFQSHLFGRFNPGVDIAEDGRLTLPQGDQAPWKVGSNGGVIGCPFTILSKQQNKELFLMVADLVDSHNPPLQLLY